MNNALMCIPSDDTLNYHFGRLQLVLGNFEHSTKWTKKLNSMKVSKVVKPTNKKTLL